ncbi:hypothetical protein CTAYLR_001062 [Chrysophaeum taylorii]|uniref:WWE domain-containing protein n=1 Tax=Chrysophaeum taylorii TaxID=2483200 RepID=A0AAD7XLM4_9STRA|nr:hypothetical protein CTAYLR_001062 [Chrysophaeum taylorii]
MTVIPHALAAICVVGILVVMGVSYVAYWYGRNSYREGLLERASVFKVEVPFAGVSHPDDGLGSVTVVERTGSGEPDGFYVMSMVTKAREPGDDDDAHDEGKYCEPDREIVELIEDELNRFAQVKFYWEEDLERLNTHSRVFEGRWIAYSELVQEQLADVYHRFVQLPELSRDALRRAALCHSRRLESDDDDDDDEEEEEEDDGDATLRRLEEGTTGDGGCDNVDPMLYKLVIRPAEDARKIATDGRARIRHGKWLEIDVAAMTQTNLETGYVRKIRCVPGGRVVRHTWCWEEDEQRVAKWTSRERKEGEKWVKYPPHLQRRLSKLFLQHRADSRAPTTLCLDSYADVTSAGDYTYVVDVEKMLQTRRDSGTVRRVSLRIESLGATGEVGQEGLEEFDPLLLDMPSNIPGAETLPLSPGSFVCVIKYHDEHDAWAYGTEIATDRFGWFPVSCVTPATLASLPAYASDTMFGDLDLLVPPPSWKGHDEDGATVISACARETDEIVRWFSINEARPLKVLAVERVQNVALWRSYASKLLRTLHANAADVKHGAPFERFPVFRGTTADAIPTIVEVGFTSEKEEDIDDDNTRNSRHQRDVGFATVLDDFEDPEFPTYAPSDAKGIRRVFVCRMIQVPNAAAAAMCGDVRQRPKVLVPEDELHVYPAFLVTFRALLPRTAVP